jgi:hypothetical protein
MRLFILPLRVDAPLNVFLKCLIIVSFLIAEGINSEAKSNCGLFPKTPNQVTVFENPMVKNLQLKIGDT